MWIYKCVRVVGLDVGREEALFVLSCLVGYRSRQSFLVLEAVYERKNERTVGLRYVD